MKRRLIELTILLVVLGAIGLVVLVTGIVPVKASSGHWPATAWLLDFASDRSVAFRSHQVEVPELDEPGMLILGASIYRSNCVFCHGEPGEDQPPVAKGMAPTPPLLSKSASEMNAQDLFYIVKHGIKFAGMPAWPTQTRDEEIWPVIAFMQQMPTMDNATYQDLIHHETNATLLNGCASCHGADGNGRAGKRVPILAAQSRGYLRNSLIAYRQGNRRSGIMMPIAHRLKDDQIEWLANFFSDQTRQTSETSNDLQIASIESGKQLAHEGDRSNKIPSCVDCHGPGGSKQNDDYPRLAGQSVWYLEQQLKLFADQVRGGSENASLMHPIADKLSDGNRHDLAAFYANMVEDIE